MNHYVEVVKVFGSSVWLVDRFSAFNSLPDLTPVCRNDLFLFVTATMALVFHCYSNICAFSPTSKVQAPTAT